MEKTGGFSVGTSCLWLLSIEHMASIELETLLSRHVVMSCAGSQAVPSHVLWIPAMYHFAHPNFMPHWCCTGSAIASQAPGASIDIGVV